MDDRVVKSKKKVSFGKAKVRLLFDYYNQEFAQNEKTNEKTSIEIKQPPPQPQKQPKSILKPSIRAVSLDSGLNALHIDPKRNFEKIDKNFWEPAKHTKNGRRRQASQNSKELEHGNINSEKDSFKDGNFKKSEMNESTKDEPSMKKPAVKNNEKWEGLTTSHPQGLRITSQSFVGIYSGVEADWDQTRLSLSRIGVDVGEHSLQNPRDFVTIMNMLLSAQKEQLDPQTKLGTDSIVVDHPAKMLDSNNNNGRERETIPDNIVVDHQVEMLDSKNNNRRMTKKETIPDNIVVDHQAEMLDSNNNNERMTKEETMPDNPVVDLNEEDQIIKEELTSAQLEATPKNQKLTKDELKKRIKKLRMKALIQKNSDRKIRKERSYSENDLNNVPAIECKVTNYESSFDRFRSVIKMRSSNSSSNNSKFKKEKEGSRKRSTSVNILNFFREDEVEKTRRNDCSSVEELSCDIECSSINLCSPSHKDSSDPRCYSDDDFDFPKQVSQYGSSGRDRSISCLSEGSGRSKENFKQKKEKQKIVKRDSWFLTKKQQMKSESKKRSNQKDGQKRITNDKRINLEKQFKIPGTITQKASCSNNSKKQSENISQTKSTVVETSTAASGFNNRSKISKQKAESESSPKLNEISSTRDGQNSKEKSELKMTKRQKYFSQVEDDTTSVLDHKNKSLKKEDCKNQQTLLSISNQSGSEKDNSSLSTCVSIDTVISNQSGAIKEDSSLSTCVSVDTVISNQSRSKKEDSSLSTCVSVDTVISNQSRSKKEDSSLSTCVSIDTVISNQSKAIKEDSSLSTCVSIDTVITNQSRSEKEDSSLSTCVSIHTVSVPKNKHSISNVVENTNKAEHLDDSNSIKESEKNSTIENQVKITRKNDNHTKRKETRTDSIDENNLNEDESLVDEKFLNDLWFIDAEAKRSLRSEEYLEKARNRYIPKQNNPLEANLVYTVMDAINKTPIAGILLPFTNIGYNLDSSN